MGRLNYEDADVFRPDRWIPFRKPSAYAFPVFQAGPRICLGMNMAIFEVKLIMISLLRDFSVSLTEGSHLAQSQSQPQSQSEEGGEEEKEKTKNPMYSMGTTLSVKGPFGVVFTPR